MPAGEIDTRSATRRALLSGSSILNFEPSSGALCSGIQPPCASTPWRATDRRSDDRARVTVEHVRVVLTGARSFRQAGNRWRPWRPPDPVSNAAPPGRACGPR